MKALLITFLTVFSSFIVTWAQDADRVKELEQRVQKLEERMAKLEKRSSDGQKTTEAKKMMKVARQHVELERQNFKSEDIAKAEKWYQKAAQILSDDASKSLLDSVVSVYPQFNRAGCAQLYRAQQEKEQEKERLLKDCLERFSSCYYLDGAQVGPLAMFQLAFYYRETNREHDANKLFKRLRKESPDAVGHDGELLVDKIE